MVHQFHMYRFRIVFVDHGGNARGLHKFQAEDDEAAIRVADSMNVGGIGNGYILWQEHRRVIAKDR